MKGNSLWIVMPVYNEEESVTSVLNEWLPILRNTAPDFTMLALNDGSKDKTGAILDQYALTCPELAVVHKPNSGHGQSCITGYRHALAAGADWVLQIDSDGQCDPAYFPEFWQAKEKAAVLYGYRRKRLDGFNRSIISRFVSLFAAAATGVWVRDANVPYRLMHKSILGSVLPHVSTSMHLANIQVSTLLAARKPIFWIPIVFRDRTGGSASVNTYSFIRHGITLYRQLRAAVEPKPAKTEQL